MKERFSRLEAVRDVINKNKIDSQEKLLQILKKKGFDITQATLSRDLKTLKVGKISDGWSGYYYSLPQDDSNFESKKNYIRDVRQGVLSMEFSGNVGVIKTRRGHASAVSLALDVLALPEILGTLAGDDTIIVILREDMTKEDLLEDFRTRIPDIKD